MESNYYYSKLSRYNSLKAKTKLTNENLTYVLEMYENILKKLCLNTKEEINIKELNKTLEELGIIKSNEQLEINEKDLKKIKSISKEVIKIIEDSIKPFCEKYEIDINEFQKLKNKYYYDKFENEIAPLQNTFDDLNKHEKEESKITEHKNK